MDEPILSDDYPMFAGYWYIIDGAPRRSNWQLTVAEYKKLTGAKEIRRCDAVERNLPLESWT